LPEPTDVVIAAMSADYIARHRGGSPDPQSIQAAVASGVKRAGGYCRISCDKNNPLSITDQLTNTLEKTKAEKRFVPWGYVYADFAVTGMDATRQGYQSYIAVLKDEAHVIDTTYIDDFTRAYRDKIEWWKIASCSKRLKKRMIGASDGFDLNSDHWERMIGIYGLLSRLFLKGLREKVRRGMRGAVRGTSVGRPSLGFTRRQKLDADGNVVTGGDGRPIYERCIDAATAHFRLMAFELFVVRGWTVERIAGISMN
jgi:DNA invertase Pin-like site-specific DNA recombinase